MSLIDEALKRARQEAAKQDAAAREQRWRQVPVIPALRVRPRRSGRTLLVVIAACLVLGLGIGIGISLIPMQAPAEPPAAPPTVKVAQAPPSAVEPAPVSAPPAEVAEAPEEPAPAEVPAEPEQTAAVPPPAVESPPPPAPSPAPPPPAPAAAPVTPEAAVLTYQQEIPLAAGGTLRLNGIAFSDQPVALFGDKVVAAGETIAGYKVVAIELRRVRLAGAGGELVIELP